MNHAQHPIPSRIVVMNNTGETEIRAEDRAAFDKALDVALRYSQAVTVERIEVFINGRGVWASSPEWIEHAIVVRYVSEDRAPMRIGVIQRTIGADVETCS